jgi:hypothetical protein
MLRKLRLYPCPFNRTQDKITTDFRKCDEVKHLGATPTYQNFIHKEIYGRLNSVNGCYSAVHGLLFHPFSIQRHKIKTYRTVIWPVIKFGVQRGLR